MNRIRRNWLKPTSYKVTIIRNITKQSRTSSEQLGRSVERLTAHELAQGDVIRDYVQPAAGSRQVAVGGEVEVFADDVAEDDKEDLGGQVDQIGAIRLVDGKGGQLVHEIFFVFGNFPDIRLASAWLNFFHRVVVWPGDFICSF